MKLSCPTNSPGAYADMRARCSARSNGTRSSCLMATPPPAPCLPARGRRAERREEAVTERLHGPDRRLRARRHAVLPAPSGDPVHHLGVVGNDRDGHVVAGALARDDPRGLMVAKYDEHEVLVAVALHEREDRFQRVLDRMPVGGAGPLAVAEERGLRRLLRGEAVEDRAVADVAPGDEAGNTRPRRVAR